MSSLSSVCPVTHRGNYQTLRGARLIGKVPSTPERSFKIKTKVYVETMISDHGLPSSKITRNLGSRLMNAETTMYGFYTHPSPATLSEVSDHTLAEQPYSWLQNS